MSSYFAFQFYMLHFLTFKFALIFLPDCYLHLNFYSRDMSAQAALLAARARIGDYRHSSNVQANREVARSCVLAIIVCSRLRRALTN